MTGQPAPAAERALRRWAATYFAACDVPAGVDPAVLPGLFAPDAVWEGLGSAFAAAFGRVTGREAIVAMLHRHLDGFAGNAHLLGEGLVEAADVDGSPGVRGSWVMQQTCVHLDGTADLRAARIRVEARLEGPADAPRAVATRFTTQRLVALAAAPATPVPPSTAPRPTPDASPAPAGTMTTTETTEAIR